jgi:xylan 1,4-beta-xylosidase
MKKPLLFLAGTLAAMTSTLSAETPRAIVADMADLAGPTSRMGEFCVGAGRANEGLRADWQRQLAEVKKECGFQYLRFHGLFTDDMGVVIRGRDGKILYNWQYVDELFDFMLSTGVKPFVELGFMPREIASGDKMIFWWRGNVTPPRDYADWEALVRAAVQHWTQRYGEDEVKSWFFEVWNEPNLTGFWIGETLGMTGEQWQEFAREQYFRLYDASAKAVKGVNAAYKVGGPATAGNAWVPEMLDHCAKTGVPIDFVTTHHYCVTAGFLDEFGTAGTVFAPNRGAMIDDVKRVRGEIAASAFPTLPLYYTEWSSSYTPSDPIHDSYASAAFILSKLRGVGDTAQGMSYWTFTDIFEEAGPRAQVFHGGFGLINAQDIRKCSFYAYKFLHELGGTELKNTDPESWVTRDEKGGAQALFWDFTILGPNEEGVNNQQFYNRDLPAKDAAPVALSLKNLAPGTYRLLAMRAGYRSGDAYTAYLGMGAPAQLTREQVAELKKAAEVTPFLDEVVTVAKDGAFARNFAMRQNDVVLVTLEPVK